MMGLLTRGLPLAMLIPAALACVRNVGGGGRTDVPKFCNGLECPRFQDVSTGTDKYQKRIYEPAKWFATTVMDTSHDSATSTGFRRLFDYIERDNVEGEKIDMTAPVLTRVIPGQGPACKTTFTIHFFTPFKYQNGTVPIPTPKNPDVSVVDLPEMTVYVASFGGRANENDWITHETSLGDALMKDGISFEDSLYFTAGYDSPFRLWNRHNEVWLLASGSGLSPLQTNEIC